MNLKPLADKIIAKQIEAEETTKGGFVLTSQQKELPPLAEVVAVGPGGDVNGTKVEMVVKAGDKIVYSKAPFATIEITVEDEKYLVLRQSDVLAIIE